jgi:hypothetical protein
MLFRIRFDLLQPKRGNPMQINASLHYENADFLKTQLGTFMYYHFLREFFEDISRFQRDGDIAFCKPGIGDLCITWNVPNDESHESIRDKIKEGLEYASLTEKQKYWDKYSMATTMTIAKWDTNSFVVSIEASFYSMYKTAANADWVAEV